MPPLLAETKTTDLFIRKVNDMISANNISLRVGKKALFEDVNIKFTEGNCYGLIGANGAGKSTFLKILSGQLEPTSGEVAITPGQRLSFLQQDHFKYDEYTVLDTVIMGNARLYQIMKEKEAIYMKEDFTDEDGIKAAELEGEFATMNGWEAESDAENLLNGLGIGTEFHYAQMSTLLGAQKVKVLLAQALFGNPDILLLDEPTNHLDITSKEILESALNRYTGTVLYVSHDRYFINRTATRILDLTDGSFINYIGNYDYYLEKKEDVEAAFAARQMAQTAANHPTGTNSPQAASTASGISSNRTSQTAMTASSAGSPADGKIDWKAQKEEQARLRKRQNELKKIEDKIHELETRDGEIDELLSQEDVYTDVSRLMELNKEKESIQKELEVLYEKWEELAE